jgi:hypothetical protein
MHLDIWDYLTFPSFFLLGTGTLVGLVFILGLPGRIAYARKHPDAEAINMMGWLGFLVVVPWMKAFLWAFKPTDVVDIRRFPAEEQKAIEEEMARHAGKAAPKTPDGAKGAVTSPTNTGKK